jgi:hypothetical protein
MTAIAVRRRGGAARIVAVGVSLAVHLAAFALLITGRLWPAWRESDERAVSVDLMKPAQAVRPPVRRRPASTSSAPSPSPFTSPQAPEQPSAPPSGAVVTARAAPQPPGWDARRLGSILRGSAIGCANADTVRLTPSEREACRQRLAQGAASAPFIPGAPPDKAAYWQALSESEAAMDADRLGGHGPGIVCGGRKRFGLKLGPCTVVPPMTPLTAEVDVRPPK